MMEEELDIKIKNNDICIKEEIIISTNKIQEKISLLKKESTLFILTCLANSNFDANKYIKLEKRINDIKEESETNEILYSQYLLDVSNKEKNKILLLMSEVRNNVKLVDYIENLVTGYKDIYNKLI